MLAPHAEECGQQRPAVQGALPRREHYPASVTCSRKTVRRKETHHGATVGIRRRNTRRWQKWTVGNQNKELSLKGGDSPQISIRMSYRKWRAIWGEAYRWWYKKRKRAFISSSLVTREPEKSSVLLWRLVAEFAPRNVPLAAAFVDLNINTFV